MPVMQLNAVVFPAPFGPISATISFKPTFIERSFIARTPPNCILICSAISILFLLILSLPVI